jgi:hypothetical protein
MRYLALLAAGLLLAPPLRAEIAPDTDQRAQQINMDLKQDIVDRPEDSKKITKLRGKLRDAYADYSKVLRKFGSGTPQSRKAARKVMEAQTKLHSVTDLATAPPPESKPKPAVTEKKAETKDEMNEPVPSLTKDSDETGTADEKLYNDTVKEFGKDSPQAEALRRQLGNH